MILILISVKESSAAVAEAFFLKIFPTSTWSLPSSMSKQTNAGIRSKICPESRSLIRKIWKSALRLKRTFVGSSLQHLNSISVAIHTSRKFQFYMWIYRKCLMMMMMMIGGPQHGPWRGQPCGAVAPQTTPTKTLSESSPVQVDRTTQLICKHQ